MHKALIVLATATAMAAGTGALAQKLGSGSSVQYRWHDARGLAHYSDSLSADAIANGYDVVNSRGVVVRHIDRPLTPKERELAKKQAEQPAA